MNDSIGRQETIEAVLEYLVEYCGAAFDIKMQEGMIKKLKDIPSAEKRGEWIPVSERLPQYGNYLVSYGKDEEIDIGTYNPKTGLWSACDVDGMYYVASKGLEVIAWMPLPEPYKAK